MSGPQLAQVLDHLREGHTLVVWRLDRLGRSLRHLIDTVAELEQRGVGFRSLQESIDALMTPDKLSVARELHASANHTVAAIAKVVGVSRATLYRQLNRASP